MTTDLLRHNATLALRNVETSPLFGKSVLLTGASGLIGANLRAALDATHVDGLLCPARGAKIAGTYDYIIHAAGYAQPTKFLADPLATIRVNTTMLMDLLGRLAPGGRLLFLSTSELYSGHVREFNVESDIGSTSPGHARGSYIESKRCGEAICHAARLAGKTAIVARVSSVYGPGVGRKDTRVMSEFIDAAIKYGIIEPKDGGASRRAYCYVSDAVQMLLNILLHGEHSVYNVGGKPELVTIVGLAKKISELLKVPVKMPRNAATAFEGAPAHVGVNMSRYVNEFGAPEYVGFEEGLRHTIAWHKALAGERVAA